MSTSHEVSKIALYAFNLNLHLSTVAGSNVAEIETCFTTMKSSSGDMASASWGDGSSTGCAWLQDFYSNFVPTTVSFELYVTFTTTWTSPQPAYIAYTEFGLTDVSMAAFHNTVNGNALITVLVLI